MQRFKYRAFKDNKIFSKTIEAENESGVVNYLKINGYFPLEVKKDEPISLSLFGFITNRVSFNDVVDLTRQLAIMLNAGLTLVDCFDILKKQINKPSLLKLIEDLDKNVRGGSSFSNALKKYPQYFSNLYISLVKSGEASGKLSDILLKLSENLEKQREFQGKIKGALIYPVVIMVGMVIVMFVMVTFVIPKLLSLYKDFNIELPVTTQILIVISDFTSKFWPLIIGGTFGFVVLIQNYLKTKNGKFLFDQASLKIPLVNNVVKISALVNATRTLAILIGSGVSILEALNIIIETTENIIFQEAFRKIHKQVEKGVSLGSAMQQYENIFPPILIQMTVVGEQTGHLDETLLRISRYFEVESELAVKAMTTLIEPAILVFLGLGVGTLVLSVITPIYNLTSSFQ
ncbi:type II secretion system F family protein [Candidatus Roizmanbacteria bacterium]|jgi:type IV pilus assembly protein PilC|nr:type II secretion system F family protein [Candidatus Roizmanbacteria bacterium]